MRSGVLFGLDGGTVLSIIFGRFIFINKKTDMLILNIQFD